MTITVGERFIPEKTSDEFIEVVFRYENTSWTGAIPLRLKYQGYEISIEEFKENIKSIYKEVNPENHKNWKVESDKIWTDKTTQTYKVFDALSSGNWECRVCGPVPKVNPQAASRLRDIKKKGFIVATKRKYCDSCVKNTIHDILVMVDLNQEQHRVELRKPISVKLAKRIYKLLGGMEIVFEQKRTQQELVIDHKFPSQRWTKEESDNTDDMKDSDIFDKFQLLNNQTNLLKSKECDRCIFEGIRGKFMGIKWYYSGNEEWQGTSIDDERGCIGCPWYDTKEWKRRLAASLKDNNPK